MVSPFWGKANHEGNKGAAINNESISTVQFDHFINQGKQGFH